MQMDGWQDYLHFTLRGEHVLFRSFVLDSPWHFVVASFLTAGLCLIERTLTYATSKQWYPCRAARRTRLRRAAWKTGMYWVVTFVRLLYMLVAMTFNVGLIIVTATALAVGQFVIEYADNSNPNAGESNEEYYKRSADPENIKEPLLYESSGYEPPHPLHALKYPAFRPSLDSPASSSHRTRSSSSNSSTYSYRNDAQSHLLSHSEHEPIIEVESTEALGEMAEAILQPPLQARPRSKSKSKPTDIFIHPADSNLARADAAALELGLGGDTELVKGNQFPANRETPWQVGKGKDLARELMGGSREGSVSGFH